MNKVIALLIAVIALQSSLLAILIIRLNGTSSLTVDSKYANPLYWQSSISGDDPTINEWLQLHGITPPQAIESHLREINHIGTRVNQPVTAYFPFDVKPNSLVNITSINLIFNTTEDYKWNQASSYFGYPNGTKMVGLNDMNKYETSTVIGYQTVKNTSIILKTSANQTEIDFPIVVFWDMDNGDKIRVNTTIDAITNSSYTETSYLAN